MITLLRSGHYKLIETKHNTKILYLGHQAFAWVEPAHIGEILVVTHHLHKTDCILSRGEYRLYDVHDEPSLSDLSHLELSVGEDAWQGYLLLTGLPNKKKPKARIVPTAEIITENTQALYQNRPLRFDRQSERQAMKHTFTTYEAQSIGQSIGLDFSKVDLEQFRLGLSVELEHGSHDLQTNVTDDDLETTGKIAWAHLKEMPDYYTRLTHMEAEAEQIKETS